MIRRHRSGGPDSDGLGAFKLPDDLASQLELPDGFRAGATGKEAGSGRAESWRKEARLRRLAWLAGAVLVAVAVIAMMSSSQPLFDVLRGAIGLNGAPAGSPTVRMWVKAAGLDSELVERLANEALSPSGSDTTVYAVDIDRFSIMAVRTIMSDGMPDIVISSRRDLREMADQGMLMDLAPLIERDSVDLGAFVDSCIAELTLGDTVFGLPLSTSPLLLYINQVDGLHRSASQQASCALDDLVDSKRSHGSRTRTEHRRLQLGFAPTDCAWRTWLQLASALRYLRPAVSVIPSQPLAAPKARQRARLSLMSGSSSSISPRA